MAPKANNKKVWKEAKTRCAAIVALLEQRSEFAHPEEFSIVVRYANSILDIVKDKAANVACAGLLEATVHYQSYLLAKLQAPGGLKRVLTSHRLRRKIEFFNVAVHEEAKMVLVAYKQKYGTKKIKAGRPAYYPQTTDAMALGLWEETFGISFMAPWPHFVAMMARVGPVNEPLLKYVIDTSNTGFASLWRYCEFTRGLGSIKFCLNNIEHLFKAPWFHGYLTSDEAAKLLQQRSGGTYLIRFARASPGEFALAYNNNGRVIHSLVYALLAGGFQVQEAQGTQPLVFRTLSDVIQHYAALLAKPLNDMLTRNQTMLGALTADEADEMLQGAPPGAFLYRFSSRPGMIAVSHIGVDKRSGQLAVQHSLVEKNRRGYRFQNGSYKASVDEVVQSSTVADEFKIPLRAVSFECVQPVGHAPLSNQNFSNASTGSGPHSPRAPASPRSPSSNEALSRQQAYIQRQQEERLSNQSFGNMSPNEAARAALSKERMLAQQQSERNLAERDAVIRRQQAQLDEERRRREAEEEQRQLELEMQRVELQRKAELAAMPQKEPGMYGGVPGQLAGGGGGGDGDGGGDGAVQESYGNMGTVAAAFQASGGYGGESFGQPEYGSTNAVAAHFRKVGGPGGGGGAGGGGEPPNLLGAFAKQINEAAADGGAQAESAAGFYGAVPGAPAQLPDGVEYALPSK